MCNNYVSAWQACHHPPYRGNLDSWRELYILRIQLQFGGGWDLTRTIWNLSNLNTFTHWVASIFALQGCWFHVSSMLQAISKAQHFLLWGAQMIHVRCVHVPFLIFFACLSPSLFGIGSASYGNKRQSCKHLIHRLLWYWRCEASRYMRSASVEFSWCTTVSWCCCVHLGIAVLHSVCRWIVNTELNVPKHTCTHRDQRDSKSIFGLLLFRHVCWRFAI